LDGAPTFTVFQDRIEILSKGLLAPKQTMDGFYAGESVPVNEKLARIILQLHISEQTGRGVPAIVDAYGKDAFRFSENNIKVTIPFERLSDSPDAQASFMVSEGKTLVRTSVSDENTPVTTLVVGARVSDKILEYCKVPHSILEIAGHLGYKEKKTVRKYLSPLLEEGRVAMTIPDKPNSRLQKYITIR